MLVFSCPKCLNNDLRSSLEKSGKTDSLECTSCGTNYPIINEIPRLTDLTNYAESFGYQWNIFRKSQLDSYINKPISEVRIKDATGWSDLGAVEGNLLEAGSGAGRFTEILSKTNANIFSFDFSQKKIPCLNCFYQGMPSDEILNCEAEGILGPTANVIGALQANEVLKLILGLNGIIKNNILIVDLLNLTSR